MASSPPPTRPYRTRGASRTVTTTTKPKRTTRTNKTVKQETEPILSMNKYTDQGKKRSLHDKNNSKSVEQIMKKDLSRLLPLQRNVRAKHP